MYVNIVKATISFVIILGKVTFMFFFSSPPGGGGVIYNRIPKSVIQSSFRVII